MGESVRFKNRELLKKFVDKTKPCNDCKKYDTCNSISTVLYNRMIELFPVKVECALYEPDESKILDGVVDMLFSKKNE